MKGRLIYIFIAFFALALIAEWAYPTIAIAEVQSQWNFPNIEYCNSISDVFKYMIWYNHANPPVHGLLFGFCKVLLGSYYPYGIIFFFSIVYALSAILFLKSCVILFKSDRIAFWVCALFFLNPATIIAFKYPLYSVLMFGLSSAIVYWASKPKTHLHLAVLFISLAPLVRNAFHLYYVMVLIALLLIIVRPDNKMLIKSIKWAVLGLSFVVIFYLKNQYVFGFFGSSSYSATNVVKNYTGTLFPPDSVDNLKLSNAYWLVASAPDSAFNRTESDYIAKYSDIKPLTDSSLFNIKTIVLANRNKLLIQRKIKKIIESGISNSEALAIIKTVGLGLTYAYRTTVNYRAYRELIPNNWPIIDWFVPINQRSNVLLKHFPVYALYLIFALMVFLKPNNYPRQMLFFMFLAVSHTFITAIIDNREAMRMRLEVEPFYFIASAFVIKTLFGKKEEQTNATSEA